MAAIFSAFFFSLPSCDTLFCVTLSSFMDFYEAERTGEDRMPK